MTGRLNKIITGFRVLQCPLSFVFLICICWLEAVMHEGSSHVATTVLRFLAALLTWPFTAWEIYFFIKKRDLAVQSKTYKGLRLGAEFGLGGLWFVALILGAAMSNTTMGTTNSSVVTPALIASAIWVIEIILFVGTCIGVLVQTIRKWRPAPAQPAKPEFEA